MYKFIVRLVIFSLLWLGMMVTNDEHITLSIFMFTLSLMCFFFLSKADISLLLPLTIGIVIFLHAYVIVETFYSSVLLMFLIYIMVHRFTNRLFYILVILHSVLSLTLVYIHSEKILAYMIVGILFIGAILRMRTVTKLYSDERDENEHLKTEYRSLKRMHITAEDMARTEERTRIAREIHDSVGHQLTALMMKLEMLHIENPEGSYATLKAMAKSSLIETRHAVETLQGDDVQGLAAIVQLVRKLEAENQLLTTLTMKEGILSLPLSNKHSVVLYRLIQEALTNVMRHADTKQVHILIGKSAMDTLHFKVTNPVGTPRKVIHGFGLTNLQGRVAEIGGKVDVYQADNMFIIEGMMPYE